MRRGWGLATLVAAMLLWISPSYGAGSWQILTTGKLLIPGSIGVSVVGPRAVYPSIQLSVTQGRLHFTERLKRQSGKYTTRIQLVATGPLILKAKSPGGVPLAQRTLQITATPSAVASRYGLAAIFILILLWVWRRNRQQLARYNDPQNPRD